MALEFHSGFETSDFTEWSGSSGTVSVQGTIKKTGDYAMRANPTAGTGYVTLAPSYWRRLTVYIRIGSAPDQECIIIGNDTGSIGVNVRLTTDRYLKLYDGGSLKDTGSTQLVVDTFYRVSVSLDAPNDNCKVYLDGIEELSTTSHTAAPEDQVLGVATVGTTVDIYYDDYAHDYTDSTDDLGDIRVVRSQPDADGTNQDFDTSEPVQSRPWYDKVNEVPADDANYVAQVAQADVEETYDLEECSGLGIGSSDTIEAVSVWCRMQRGSGPGTTHQIVVYDGGNYEYTVTLTTSWAWVNKYFATKPSGGSWTQSAFDAFEAGAGNNNGKQDTYLACVMVMVAYKIPAATTAYKDIATRFKLTVQAFKDIATRFRLWVQGYQDIATRFKLIVQGYQDISTRFKLSTGTLAYKDIATRFKLIVQGYQDIATRFKLTVQGYQDVATRFRLWVQGYQDISTRFKLWVQGYQDAATRFRLGLPYYKDIATRFKLTVQGYQDIATRFKLTVQSYQDIATRFKLTVQSYQDVATRFILSAGTLAYKDIATRFKLTVQGYQDAATRFRLGLPYYKDIATRFKLTVQGYQDVATRFRLWVQGYQDISTRFRLTVQNFKDIATRFKLRVQGYQDIATRFRLTVQNFKDIATRFKLGIQGYLDIATRFKLAVQGYQDIATRFRLITGTLAYKDIATHFRLNVQGYQDIATRFRLTVAQPQPKPHSVSGGLEMAFFSPVRGARKGQLI